MDTGAIAAIIEDGVDGINHVEVTTRDDHPEDDHYQVVVVATAFKGRTLVEQHQLVYDALDGHMTTDIHALELTTYTPTEYTD